MLCIASPVSAQEITAQGIDPATITTPDLTFVPTAKDRTNFHKYFYYWKPGVSFERAHSDLSECYLFVTPRPAYLPFHLDISDEVLLAPPPRSGATQFGLIGAILAGPVVPDMSFEAIQQRFRTCMGFKNYVRYGTSEALWKQIHGKDGERSLRIIAKIASGPEPEGERVDP